MLVLFQDFKNRLVFWFFYPIIGILSFLIQIQNVTITIALTNLSFNLLLVALILGITSVYVRLRKLDLKKAIGIGDVLFFIFICCTFSIISFLVLFVFALLFSLILHYILDNKDKQETVPLAGYMSLFFGVVYVTSFFYDLTFLYSY